MSDVDAADPARRPLKSRQTRWAAFLASRLARSRVTPNAISLFSIACAALAAAALVGTRYVDRPTVDASLFALAIVGIQGRLLCNLLDGMVAVEGGKKTPAGELFNEVPDRVADSLILVAAGYAGDPAYGPTLGWLAALLAMFTAYVRVLGKAAGAGVYFIGPMAKQQRMAVMTVACLAAALWVMMTAPKAPHHAPVIFSFTLAIVCVGCVPTAWRRVSRIAADLRAASA